MIEPAQRCAARLIGAAYLAAMVTSIFAKSHMHGSLIVVDDAHATMRNLMGHKALFRLGITMELLTFIADQVLIAALYSVLSPVNRNLAAFAALVRVAAVAVSMNMTADSFEALRILGEVEPLRAFAPDQLAALARISICAHAASYNMVLFGLGSAVFAWLWLNSGYVARGWGLLGIAASASISSALARRRKATVPSSIAGISSMVPSSACTARRRRITPRSSRCWTTTRSGC